MSGKLSKQFNSFIVLLKILLVLLLFLLAYNFFLPLGKGKPLVYFSDNNLSAVLKTLKRNGYNITEWDRYLLSESSLPKQGWYHIRHTDNGRYHFFKHLDSHPAETMQIRIYPGETHLELLKRLANDMKLNETLLHTVYEKMMRFNEADIFAGEYTVARKADENTTMQYLFSHSHKILETFKKKNFTSKIDNYTIQLLLTIASIIQKESNDPKEMPLISSVIYNRLKRGMKLQMDGTLNYGEYSHKIVTPERIKTDTSFYNTYKYKGLPPAPLSTVSLEALEAAMFPAESDYLFFMLHKDGGHKFAKTYKEHLANIKAFRRYQKERKKKLHTKQKIEESNKFRIKKIKTDL